MIPGCVCSCILINAFACSSFNPCFRLGCLYTILERLIPYYEEKVLTDADSDREYYRPNDPNHESDCWQDNHKWDVFFRNTAIHRVLHVEVGFRKKKRKWETVILHPARPGTSLFPTLCSSTWMFWHIFRKTRLASGANFQNNQIIHTCLFPSWKIRSLQGCTFLTSTGHLI